MNTSPTLEQLLIASIIKKRNSYRLLTANSRVGGIPSAVDDVETLLEIIISISKGQQDASATSQQQASDPKTTYATAHTPTDYQAALSQIPQIVSRQKCKECSGTGTDHPCSYKSRNTDDDSCPRCKGTGFEPTQEEAQPINAPPSSPNEGQDPGSIVQEQINRRIDDY